MPADTGNCFIVDLDSVPVTILSYYIDKNENELSKNGIRKSGP
jgi:hypothetical protein